MEEERSLEEKTTHRKGREGKWKSSAPPQSSLYDSERSEKIEEIIYMYIQYKDERQQQHPRKLKEPTTEGEFLYRTNVKEEKEK